MKSFLILILQMITVRAWPCIHYPKDFNGNLREGLQEFFLFHDGNKAHVVLSTQLEAEKFPKEISWVLPLPSVPTKYEEVDGPFFRELQNMFPNTTDLIGTENRSNGFGKGFPQKSAAIRVHKQVDVGQYQIQTIEIMKDDSGEELNTWLKNHNYNSMPAEKQKKYLKKGAAFLAIRMTMNHPVEGKLVSKPLHITYNADRLTVPLIFTHDSRTFNLNLYVFSQKEMKKDLNEFYLERSESVPYKDDHMKPFVDHLLRDRKGWITLYRGLALNSGKKLLKKLESDPSFLLTEL